MKRKSLGRDRRGGTLALVAISMIMLLGFGALAVDLSMAFSARAEAQRIADSASLAGASSFLDYAIAEATPPANDRAYEYALLHTIKGQLVDSSEVTVQVIPDSMKVRVGIRRTNINTWFGKILGRDFLDIGAHAAAAAFQAGTAKCLKPFAVPDMWQDNDNDDGDRIWQDGEEWAFDPDVDHYQRYLGEGATDAEYAADASAHGYQGVPPVGYGSDWRDGSGVLADQGRQITLKVSNPQSEYVLTPGLFYPWRLPIDPNQADCDKGGGGGQDAGGAVYRKNICECNQSEIDLFSPYDLEPGNMIGPTQQGVGELVDDDPNAFWNTATNTVDSHDVDWPYRDNPTGSPRVIKIALFDISQITQPGMQSIEFNNFALFFIEAQGSGQDPILGRFIKYAGGDGEGSGGPNTGSLVLYIRIVE